jgi:hypothetical protein
MSKEAVQAVIGKAVTDGKFREELFANPDHALSGFELTEAEIAALKNVDAETLESFAGTLDERISKAFAQGIYAGMASAGGGPTEPLLSGRFGKEEGF